ncbi:MAG TPA: FAD-dependent monooxygenase [Galbitalea sp.]|jgi:salicylate hydroxylase/6-hydroxynicotinate 3-monooxygenase
MAKIAIIGAGIGGLALSACLRQQGIESTIYEQATAFKRVGAGIQMGPNAMKILRGLGLEGELAKNAYSPPFLDNKDWDTGVSTFALPVGDSAEETYGAPYYMLHRADLHELLLGLVPRDTIKLKHELVDIQLADDGPTHLVFDNGFEDDADVVIGADGVHSLVRSSLFPHRDALFTGKVAYRTVFPTELMGELRPGPATKWWGVDRHIVIYYVSGGREIYFTTSVPDPTWTLESFSAEGSLDDLREAFRGFHPEVEAVLAATPSVHKWAIYDRDPMDSWHVGNVALLGDSCHPMTPFMAQGAATSMEDAVILTRLLVRDGFDDLPATFANYEAVRKPRTSRIQLGSRGNDWLRFPTDPHWVYGYDAWTASLDPETDGEVSVEAAQGAER